MGGALDELVGTLYELALMRVAASASDTISRGGKLITTISQEYETRNGGNGPYMSRELEWENRRIGDTDIP